MQIERRVPSKILTPTNGFLTGYTHSLNPYMGCQFACSYCYVKEMPLAKFRGQAWGTWVDIKEQAAEKLKRELQTAKKKGTVSIFMSSATDPYQPVEYQERITRSLLEVMTENKPDFLFVQTRSPLVTRDIDLFLEMKDRIRISMTIETDREDMRKHFTPNAPPLAARMEALKRLYEAKLDVQAAISPILPSTEQFADKMLECTPRICLDNYLGDGAGGKRTARMGIYRKYEEVDLADWYQPEALEKVRQQFLQVYPEGQVFISQCGFSPN